MTKHKVLADELGRGLSLLAIMIAFVTGCPASRTSPMNTAIPLLERCKATGTTCRVRLSEVTRFEWDRVAFVRMQTPPTQAASALGLKELAIPEFEDWIVFLKGDRIASVDIRRYNPEQPFDQTVFLDFSGTREMWKIFTRDQDLFEVVINSSSGRNNIILKPVQASVSVPTHQE